MINLVNLQKTGTTKQLKIQLANIKYQVMKQNMVSWFEIPVTNMDRAKAFYETVFNVEMTLQNAKGNRIALYSKN